MEKEKYGIQDLQADLAKEKKLGRLAFVLGNGINRYNPNDVSWESLLKKIWSVYFDGNFPFSSDSITLPELYDLISIKVDAIPSDQDNDRNKKMQKVLTDVKAKIRFSIKEEVCRRINYHKWLQEKLSEWDVPVLTTNYDANIEEKMKQYVIPSKLYANGFSDTYLFNVYYASKQIKASDEDEYFKHFAVWHINGRINHLRSIRIGMSDYMNLMTTTKDILHNRAHLYNVKEGQYKWGMIGAADKEPTYTFTWLNIIYNSSICINGLALGSEESYLRWLLISRKKYLDRVGLKEVRGWYICRSSDMTDSKRFFFELVGLKVVELGDFKECYEKIFEL